MQSLQSSVGKITVSTRRPEAARIELKSFFIVFAHSFPSSSRFPPGDGGGLADQRGGSASLHQHKHDTDHQDCELGGPRVT